MGLLSPCDSATDTEGAEKGDSKRSSKYGSIGERLYRQSIKNVDSNLVQPQVIAKLDSKNNSSQGPAFSHSAVSRNLQPESQTNVGKISPLDAHLKHAHVTHGSTQDISVRPLAPPISQQDMSAEENEQILNSILSEAPKPTRDVSYSTIPDFIKEEAILKTEQSQGTLPVSLALKKKRDKSLLSMTRQKTPPKAKKIEDIGTILNRVERANCCLQPRHPERLDVMARAVGDGSEYVQNPMSRAHYIRYKFL